MVQELDIKIRHRSGRSNSNKDALSRAPIDPKEGMPQDEIEGVVASVCREEDLSVLQQQDTGLAAMTEYLETGLLPTDEELARQTALTASQYVVEDRILYHVEPDGTL